MLQALADFLAGPMHREDGGLFAQEYLQMAALRRIWPDYERSWRMRLRIAARPDPISVGRIFLCAPLLAAEAMKLPRVSWN